jgi:hypothetical protein
MIMDALIIALWFIIPIVLNFDYDGLKKDDE